jgi:hypothetical protein
LIRQEGWDGLGFSLDAGLSGFVIDGKVCFITKNLSKKIDFIRDCYFWIITKMKNVI